MKKNNSNLKKILIISFVVLLVITIILSVMNKKSNNAKAIVEMDYIIEKETDFTPQKGLLPLINLKGDDIQNINDEIINKYYDVCYTSWDMFAYEYSVYDNILSLLITVTKNDGSEYGKIEYTTYNIDIKEGRKLNDSELLDVLNLNNLQIDDLINERLKKYYDVDELKTKYNMSFNSYKEQLKYDQSKNQLLIKNNQLYIYFSIQPTLSLINMIANNEFNFDGDLYMFKLSNL